jgi:methylthioribose-1-phosphate isomerase
MSGVNLEGKTEKVRVAAPGSAALNPAFDVTPAEYITGFITSKGIIKPHAEAIVRLFT